ncbi:MAG: protein translocase subunit SecD [Pseudomonadota bacterium]|nr:protein translocase subunit SecD [Pseudomonadota bacterium]
MIHFAKWKIIMVLGVCLFGILYSAPNLMSSSILEKMEDAPGWLPTKSVNLGLDLRGGSYLLLQVDVDDVTRENLNRTVDTVRDAFRESKIGYKNLGTTDKSIVFQLIDEANEAKARELVREIDRDVSIEVDDLKNFVIRPTEQSIEDLARSAVDTSIEIVRNRIDETGTREPIIQRQGRDRILIQLPGIDDPERVKRLIGKTAKLSFHLVDETADLVAALDGRVPPDCMLLNQRDTEMEPQLLIKKRVYVSGEQLVDAAMTFYTMGPAVNIRFSGAGARAFGNVTKNNVDRRLAIVLDNEIISAPNINEPIHGGRAMISGRFTVQEAEDLARLLRAGALPAPLNVIEERSVGPSLGHDSVEAGKIASMVGLTLVICFMTLIYGLFGVFTSIALLMNVALIFAVLSLLQATLTLPGIAGIVLTVGMAVDANVLIFERIREEFRIGRSPISAIDAGYSRAMSTIIDANLTTLIAATFLYALGSGPVRGFAVTLAIGIMTSMFSAIMITRLMVVTWLKKNKPKTLSL